MTLKEAIDSLSELNEFSTIYARQPWERESACVVIPMDEYGNPAEPPPAGFEYFLEVFVALENFPDDNRLSADQRFERIRYYAVNDA